jgi:ABC-type transport system involved in multi-copper enzyme maturation permease subunit
MAGEWDRIIMLGPILSRELQTAARRGRTYRRRCVLAGALLLALSLLLGMVAYGKGQELSIREMAEFSTTVFGLAAQCLVALTIWLVPACLAPAIAEEKERRTIVNLLTTRLSGAEIVLGKLAAGLVQYAMCLLTTLPIMIVLPLLGGVDPRLVVLLYAGTASTAFFVAGLSILVSTAAWRGARAVGEAVGLAAVWCSLPVVVHELTPRVLPSLWPWVHPVNQWLLASAPTGVMMSAVGAGPAWKFAESVLWMIGLQLAGGSLLIAWAVARFRAAGRAEEGQRSLGWLRASVLWWRLNRRPSCGENPVLWKELHTARPRGLGDVVGLLVVACLVALVGYGTYDFARAAFLELFAVGSGSAASDAARTEFNHFLRYSSSCVEFLLLLVAAAVAAGGVTSERARQTWDSLIVTPLDGRAIVRAKMIGSAWKVRGGVGVLAALWLVGLLAGALHPLGVAAAVVLMCGATWFVVALGTFLSLASRDTAQASSRTLVPVLLLSGSLLTCYMPARAATILSGAASVPLVNWLSLVSFRDVREVLSGQDTFRPLEEVGIFTYESPLRVLATCVLGIGGIAMASIWLSRATLARFDCAVDRPDRARQSHAATGLPADSQPPWWRRHRRVVFGLLPALAALVLAASIPSRRAERALRTALAETDRLCPGWRLDDLEAARARPPEAEDAARRVLAADLMLAARWRGERDTPSGAERERLDLQAGHLPAECLGRRGLDSLRSALGAVAPALREARSLADLPAGHFSVLWAPDGISTRLHHLAAVRNVANLLACDALLRAQEQDVENALRACRALLNTARSIGDEPALVSQLDRAEIRATACQQIELALAHGQVSDAVLAQLQRELDAEQAEPLLWFGVKGERAIMDRFVANVQSGAFAPGQLRNTGDFRTVLLLARTAPSTRAAMLRFHNRVEAIAMLPEAEQPARLERLEASAAEMPRAARLLAPSYVRAAAKLRRSRAQLRCAAAALAAERYRLVHGDWPSTLEALVPEHLAERATDPAGGTPLRYRRVGDGAVIDAPAEADGTASGTPAFRLWDPPQRHRPPPL